MPRTTIIAAVAALTLAVPAGAHRGDIWYDTAARTARNIEDRFSATVSAARCWPLPVSLRARYDADSYVRNDVRRWDHFQCGVAIRRGRVCFTVAHMTGKEWNQFVLTSYPSQGCSPYELRP